MKNKIIIAVAVFVLGFTFSTTLLSVKAEGQKVQKTTVTTVEKTKKTVLNKNLQNAPQMQPQNAEVVTYSENYTPEAYDKNRKFIDDTKKEIFSLLERIKTNIEYV